MWVTVAAVLVVLGVVGIWGVLQASQVEALARAGRTDVSAGLRSLQANETGEAVASFERAADAFGHARAMLGPGWLRDVPWLGSQLSAADDIMAIGVAASRAGSDVAQLYDELGRLTGDNRVGQLVTRERPRLDAALSSLVDVAQGYRELSPDGLVPPLADAVGQVRALLAPLAPILARSSSILSIERYLFSTDHRFLLVAQNSSELRPTGGFMGTYGLLNFGPTGLKLEKFADVYTLPAHDTLDLPLPPGGWIEPHLYFRNSNWSMDFPSSASSMLALWRNLGQPKVDGVIAIDIPVLQAMLHVHGPIIVPESDKVLTASTVMEQLNEVVQYDLSGQDDRSQRKLAVVSLVNELFRWLVALPAATARPVLDSLVRAANAKHIQIFLTEPSAHAALVDIGWSGALDVPDATTDLLAVCNALTRPSKANIGVGKSLAYTVALAADGPSATTLTLGFHKDPTLYKGVPQQWAAISTRVHRLAGAQLTSAEGFTEMRDGIGLPTFGHFLRLDPGASKAIVLGSSVPDALHTEPDGTRSYHLLLARQADLVDTAATITIVAPDGWKFTTATALLRVSRGTVATSGDGTTVTLTTPLTEDLLLDAALVRT